MRWPIFYLSILGGEGWEWGQIFFRSFAFGYIKVYICTLVKQRDSFSSSYFSFLLLVFSSSDDPVQGQHIIIILVIIIITLKGTGGTHAKD